MPLSSCSDSELMMAVADNDKDAFKEIMQRYQARVYRLVYRFTSDEEITKELTQDIFLKLYKAAGSYSPDAQFFTWLYRIVTNYCINFTRKKKRDPLHHTDETLDEKNSVVYGGSGHNNQLSTLEKEERAVLVRKALDSLPERQRMAIVLLRFEGLGYREISKAMGCSVSAVESLIYRGMDALKKRFSVVWE